MGFLWLKVKQENEVICYRELQELDERLENFIYTVVFSD